MLHTNPYFLYSNLLFPNKAIEMVESAIMGWRNSRFKDLSMMGVFQHTGKSEEDNQHI